MKKRRKRWLKSRQKAYRREKFIEAFRKCFAAKGIVEK